MAWRFFFLGFELSSESDGEYYLLGFIFLPNLDFMFDYNFRPRFVSFFTSFTSFLSTTTYYRFLGSYGTFLIVGFFFSSGGALTSFPRQFAKLD